MVLPSPQKRLPLSAVFGGGELRRGGVELFDHDHVRVDGDRTDFGLEGRRVADDVLPVGRADHRVEAVMQRGDVAGEFVAQSIDVFADENSAGA